MNQDLLNQIVVHCLRHDGVPKANMSSDAWWIRHSLLLLKEAILKETLFLDSTASWAQRLWHIRNSVSDIPKCPICLRPNHWHKSTSDYSKTCSRACSARRVYDAQREILLAEYGVENRFQLSDTKEKTKATLIKKYGVENYAKSEIFRDKMSQWHQTDYGVTAKLKRENTCQEKYGDKYPLSSPEIRQKGRTQLAKRYGVDTPLKIPEIQARRLATNKERFGIEHYTQSHLSDCTILNLRNKDWIIDQLSTKSLRTISAETGYSYSHLCKLIREHGIDISTRSSFQTEISMFIQSFGIPLVENSRQILPSGLELDIYLPSLRIAIECNGDYWHSENGGNKGKEYHSSKTNECLANDIKLIHIFEHQWHSKKAIFESMLAHILKKTSARIHARQCQVVPISSSQANEFFEKNHLQGYCGGRHRYGLVSKHSGELVAAMVVGISRFDKSTEYELIRFATLLNTSVMGAASKLFHTFLNENNVSSIVSYADRNWSTGSIYQILGFSFAGITPPSFLFRSSSGAIYSRYDLQKHKLPAVLKVYNHSLTAQENINNNGFDRIWMTGNTKWIYRRPAE